MTAHQLPQGSTPKRSYPDHWERYSLRERIVQWIWLGGIAIAAAWSVSALDIEWAFFADAHEQAADLISRMWPPRWTYLPRIVQPLIETLHIATLGTMIAIVFALPVAFLAARNTTYNQATWLIGRAMLVLSRSINTVIWGLVFVAIFGPGPVAGICAVAARSIGFIAKLVAEAIEEVDAGQIEAVESTGASTLQVYGVAILPQIIGRSRRKACSSTGFQPATDWLSGSMLITNRKSAASADPTSVSPSPAARRSSPGRASSRQRVPRLR